MQIGINNLLWLSAQTLAQTSVILQLYIHPRAIHPLEGGGFQRS